MIIGSSKHNDNFYLSEIVLRRHVNLKAINRSEYLKKENEFSRSNHTNYGIRLINSSIIHQSLITTEKIVPVPWRKYNPLLTA